MATTQQTPDYALFVDWETTGATFGGDSTIKYQGIAVGAVVVSTKDFSEVDSFYSLVQFDDSKYEWTEGAEKIHGLSREHLLQNGLPQQQVAENFLEFVFKYFGTSKIMFGGHNDEFDRRFTNQLMNSIGVEFSIENSGKYDVHVQLHHVTLNTACVGFANFGLFKSDLLFDMVGIPKRGDHNALDDARAAVAVVRTVRAITKEVLNG